MQNVKTISAIVLIAFISLMSIAHAYHLWETLSDRIERENRTRLISCLDEASRKSTSQEILQAKNHCSQNILATYHDPVWDTGSLKLNTGTLAHQSEPPSQIREKICSNSPKSPLCNIENYNMAHAIAYKKALLWNIQDKELFFRVWIGIMNAESSIGTNYAGTCDASYNNFGGIKWRILDDWGQVKDQTIPQNWCWLYKFNTLEDYFGSKYNSLGKWYGSCFHTNDPVYCISGYYVGTPYSVSWQKNVNLFSK